MSARNTGAEDPRPMTDPQRCPACGAFFQLIERSATAPRKGLL